MIEKIQKILEIILYFIKLFIPKSKTVFTINELDELRSLERGSIVIGNHEKVERYNKLYNFIFTLQEVEVLERYKDRSIVFRILYTQVKL